MPWVASHWASSSTSLGRRLTKEPRKLGIAQKEQRRSQPLASLSGAIGPASSRRRTARGPVAGAPAPISETSGGRLVGVAGHRDRRGVAVDRG